MNLNALMPYVVIAGLLAVIVVRLKIGRNRARKEETEGKSRSALTSKIAIAWFAVILVAFLLLFLLPPPENKKKPGQASEPTASSGRGSP